MKGFTLIEVLVVIAIVGIISAGALFSFARFRADNSLIAAADFVKTYLEKSRTSALAQEDGAGYGVKINVDGLIWFKGQSFNPADPANKNLGWVSGTAVTAVSLENSGSAVYFNNLTGTTSPGYITVAVSSNPGQTATVYINRSGAVYLAPDGTVGVAKPTTDNRHLHFNLGWSIQNAMELKLTFLVEPNDIRTMTMTPYFNADKTSWDYTSTSTVAGETQEIRIHTHTLDAGNTLLSITRDMTANSKPVEIAIDNKSIVTYNADGSATAGAFGGEMAKQ